MMVEPNKAVLDMHTRMYESEGINIPYNTWRTVKKPVSDASINVEISANLRSARAVFTTIMEEEAFNDTEAAKAYPSNSCFRKSGLKRWQYKSGGLRFPEHGPVNCETLYAPETFTLAQIAVQNHGSTLLDTRMRLWEVANDTTKTYSGSGGNKTIADSTKFIIGCPLARQDAFSGVDLSGNSLFFEAECDSGATGYVTNKQVLNFVLYDSILTLQYDRGSIIKY